MLKICTKCLQAKHETDFAFKRTKANPQRRNRQCRACVNAQQTTWRHKDISAYNAMIVARRKERGEEYKKVKRSHYAKNKEKIRAQYHVKKSQRTVQEIAQEKEKSTAYNKQYWLKNKKILQEKNKLYKENNPDKIKQIMEEWRIKNRERIRENGHRRRANQANAPLNDLSENQWQEIKKAFRFCCAYCGKKTQQLTMDHVTPYAHNGSHTLWNIVPACTPCNSRKHAGPPPTPVQPLLLTVAPPRKERAKG